MLDLRLALQGDRTDRSFCELQIAKLLIIPFVCGVESVWLGKVFSRSIIASIFTVLGRGECQVATKLCLLLAAGA